MGIDCVQSPEKLNTSVRQVNLTSWVESSGEVEPVDCGGVAQVVGEVLQRSLACDNGLDKESKHGEHSLQPYQLRSAHHEGSYAEMHYVGNLCSSQNCLGALSTTG